MVKRFETVIQLRRDNDYNFERIKDTFIPSNGEVVLVDTARDGLRAKVGDGYSTYAQLNFTDQDLRNTVLHGWFKDDIFYQDEILSVPMNPMVNKIYIDNFTNTLYFHDGQHYVTFKPPTFNTATATDPGAMKLYNTVGYNVDGTMTQKAITEELDVRYKTEIDDDNELLIFVLQ